MPYLRADLTMPSAEKPSRPMPHCSRIQRCLSCDHNSSATWQGRPLHIRPYLICCRMGTRDFLWNNLCVDCACFASSFFVNGSASFFSCLAGRTIACNNFVSCFATCSRCCISLASFWRNGGAYRCFIFMWYIFNFS